MTESVPLTSGAYQAPSIIAGAQRCVNLFPETTPSNTNPPMPVTHYQRPGKILRGSPQLSAAGPNGLGRALFTASDGDLFAVVNDTVYFVDPTYRFFTLGTIGAGINPVSMADNGKSAGNSIALVDGTANGYQISMTTYGFAPIVDGTGLFTGADIVQYLQTFFIFNTIPNSQNFIISQPNSLTFDPLDIASKSSYPDNIATIGIRQREVWLMGTLSTEPWFLSGAADFPFEAMPATYVSYGVMAKYSLVFADDSLFWLSRNTQGKAIVVKSNNYSAERISNHAIEAIIQRLLNIEDCVGSTYQVQGHTFIVLTFRTGNLTLAYDLATKQWHQLAHTDDNGNLNRDRVIFYTQAYGKNLGMDWETGEIYEIDPDTFTDNGDTISFIRSFPTMTSKLDRVTHWSFTAYMETGTIEDPNADEPMLGLRVSDDGGKTFNATYQTSLGDSGEYLTTPQFTRLGMARNRVYELFWSANMKTALNGAYVDIEVAES